MRRRSVRPIELEHHTGRLRRVRHDLDPLVDKQASQRTRGVERRNRLDDEREARWCQRSISRERQADPPIAVAIRQLRHAQVELLARGHGVRVANRRFEPLDTVADAARTREPRDDGQRIAILYVRAARERVLDFVRVGGPEERQHDERFAEHRPQSRDVIITRIVVCRGRGSGLEVALQSRRAARCARRPACRSRSPAWTARLDPHLSRRLAISAPPRRRRNVRTAGGDREPSRGPPDSTARATRSDPWKSCAALRPPDSPAPADPPGRFRPG